MNARIMLVDDEEAIRESVEIFFQASDIDLLTAASGNECIEYLEAGFRGLILMDVMMPGMNGWETIRNIIERSLFEGNIIVMLTALSAPDCSMEGIQEYVTDYMTKPFNPNEMLESVNYYLTLLDGSGPADGQ